VTFEDQGLGKKLFAVPLCPKQILHGLRGRFRFRIRFRGSAPVGAKNVRCVTVQVRTVVAGSGGSVRTVGGRRFAGMISSFLFRLSESESEPESACTIRVVAQRLEACLCSETSASRCLRTALLFPSTKTSALSSY
jgi:hypothetical protein